MTHANEQSKSSGPLVWLRDVQPADLEVFFDQQNDPIAHQMAMFAPRDRAAFFRHWQQVVLKQPDNCVKSIIVAGQKDLNVSHAPEMSNDNVSSEAVSATEHVAGHMVCWPNEGQQQLGYWLGQAYWQQGIATQALHLFLQIVTTRPIVAHVAIQNIGSIKVLERNGFHHRGQQRLFCDALQQDVEEVLLRLD